MSPTAIDDALALPIDERSAALLGLPENQWFDRKSARISPKDLADAIIGFANAEGGAIVVGIWNDTVEGIDAATADQISGWQQAAIDFTTPPARASVRLADCTDSAGAANRVAVVTVAPSDLVHSNRKDEVYLRIGDENRKLGFTQRQELLFDKGQSSYETTTVHDATPAHLDSDLTEEYSRILGHPEPGRLLTARGLVTPTDEVTVAAALLFHPEPQQWFPAACIRVLRYRGSERGTGSRQQLIHDRRIEGPIPRQLEQARNEITLHTPTRRALGPDGRFDDVAIIPTDAWFEGVVNAAVHRSYSISGDHIRVEIFDDRMEIESPGRFPGISDIAEPSDVVRFARNPRIARVCSEFAFGQELGEGIRRIFDEMRIAGLADPAYRQTSGSVRLTLTAAPAPDAADEPLPPGSRDLLQLIREHGRLRTGDLVEASRLSRPVVIRRLDALRRAGLIVRVGSGPNDPTAYWTLATT
ncbi:MAG: ATP-binding protein [Acidimicrobiales bacterium]